MSALTALGIDLSSVYDVYQVHSTEIIFTDHPLHANETHLKADGIITDVPGITLLMRFADCVPILLYDPSHHAIGICHAGWLGTIHKIAERVVLEMHKHFKSDPGELTVVIGPSIGPDHYFVKPDVIEKVRASFGESSDMLSQREGKTYFDLWKANQLVLNDAGVYNIEVTGICTQCHVDDWYSHRGEHGSTGRFGIVIGLVA